MTEAPANPPCPRSRSVPPPPCSRPATPFPATRCCTPAGTPARGGAVLGLSPPARHPDARRCRAARRPRRGRLRRRHQGHQHARPARLHRDAAEGHRRGATIALDAIPTLDVALHTWLGLFPPTASCSARCPITSPPSPPSPPATWPAPTSARSTTPATSAPASATKRLSSERPKDGQDPRLLHSPQPSIEVADPHRLPPDIWIGTTGIKTHVGGVLDSRARQPLREQVRMAQWVPEKAPACLVEVLPVDEDDNPR